MSLPGIIPGAPVGGDFGQSSYNGGQFPALEYAGALYAFTTQNSPTYSIPSPTLDLRLHCFQSTDGGATWAELDAAHAPGALPENAAYQYSVVVDGTEALLLQPKPVTFSVPRGLNLIRFNLATGLWGSITALSAIVEPVYAASVVIAHWARLVVLAPGSYVMFYSGPAAVVSGDPWARIYYATFNGTTFGTPVAMPGQGASDAFRYIGQSVVLDNAGRIHLEYARNGTGTLPSDIWHIALDTATWTFGAATLVSNHPYWTGGDSLLSTWSELLLYDVAGVQQIALCGETTLADFSAQSITFYTAPVALVPTFSSVAVTTGVDDTGGLRGGSDVQLFPLPACFGGGITPTIQLRELAGTIAIIWNWADPDTVAGAVMYSLSTDNGATWTAPVLLWHTQSPIPSANYTDSKPCQVFALNVTGGFGIFASCININGNGAEQIEYNLLPVTIPSPEITCDSPPVATVGLPYDHTFPVSGGTPPYTFALTAGVLPPGLTLDPATGTVSGTPTSE